MKKLLVVVMLCISLLVPAVSSADNNARDYIPAAPGCLAVLLYYTHSSADTLYNDGDKVADDIDFSGNVGIFRPVYWFEVGPLIIDAQFLLPFGDLELESTSLGNLDLSTSGLGDLILLSTIWFIHDPKEKMWLGFSPYFFLPTGHYDNHGALSLGENRFHFKEELGFVKGFEVIPGHNFYFDLTLAGDFFLENDDFGQFGRQDLNQDPLLTVETHFSFDVTEFFFASLDYYYHYGGAQEVDDIDLDNGVSNHTLGFSLAYNISPSYQIMFQYKNDVDVKSGLPTQSFLFRFLYACDVGYLFGKPALAPPSK